MVDKVDESNSVDKNREIILSWQDTLVTKKHIAEVEFKI